MEEFIKQPIAPDECKAVYHQIEGKPGVFVIQVGGEFEQSSYGLILKCDTSFDSGMKIDMMGWASAPTGNLHPYKVIGIFHGQYRPEIIISGSNGDITISVSRDTQGQEHASDNRSADVIEKPLTPDMEKLFQAAAHAYIVGNSPKVKDYEPLISALMFPLNDNFPGGG